MSHDISFTSKFRMLAFPTKYSACKTVLRKRTLFNQSGMSCSFFKILHLKIKAYTLAFQTDDFPIASRNNMAAKRE